MFAACHNKPQTCVQYILTHDDERLCVSWSICGLPISQLFVPAFIVLGWTGVSRFFIFSILKLAWITDNNINAVSPYSTVYGKTQGWLHYTRNVRPSALTMPGVSFPVSNTGSQWPKLTYIMSLIFRNISWSVWSYMQEWVQCTLHFIGVRRIMYKSHLSKSFLILGIFINAIIVNKIRKSV